MITNRIKICRETLNNPGLNIGQKIDLIAMLLTFSLTINKEDTEKEGSYNIHLLFNNKNPLSYISLCFNFFFNVFLNVFVGSIVLIFVTLKMWIRLIIADVKRINRILEEDKPYMVIENMEL